MDRRRAGSPVFSRQKSGDSSSTGSSSPAMSPAHHRSAAVGLSNVKKTQNVAAKAAAARLAQVMASQTAAENDEEEEEEEDLLTSSGAGFRYGALRPALNSNGGGVIAPAPLGRPTRSPSPALGRNFMDHAPSARSTSAGRPSISVRSAQPVPQNRTALRTPSPIPAIEPPIDRHRDKRFPIIASHPHGNIRETGNKRETSALQDELDVLQEENENLLDKLRLAEERSGEAEARARELEKQVAALGEGVSLEARLLNRKEAALRQREAALKAAKQTREGRDDEIAALRQQLESAKDEATNAMEKFHEAEIEAKTLLTMTQRMILTQEEMEEVVLKRCWLARYWGLAVQHGVFPEIAVSKHEHWSSLAPLPFEIVTSAGQKAKEDSWSQDHADPDGKNKLVRELSDINGEGNIESMLSVEMGLRELSSLKVEDAVMLELTQHRRPNLVRQSTSDLKSHGDPKFMDSVELSQEELLDILFKQAWLIYFWRRAKVHGVEEDIADDRLEFWIAKSGQQFSSHDAVDVERGLIEMRKLGIEQQLWEASRRETEEAASLDTALKPNTDAEAPA